MNLKVYSLCGGRDAQQQVLKPLNDPEWPAPCDLTQAQGASTRAADSQGTPAATAQLLS